MKHFLPFALLVTLAFTSARAQASDSVQVAVDSLLAARGVPQHLYSSINSALQPYLTAATAQNISEGWAFQIVNLDGDGTPEIAAPAPVEYEGAMQSFGQHLLRYNIETSRYELILDEQGGAVPMRTRTGGMLDISLANRGFCYSVWRWSGSEYRFSCNVPDDGRTCRNSCSNRSQDDFLFREELPGFGER